MKRLNKLTAILLGLSFLMISFQALAQKGKRGKAGDINWFSISAKGGYGTALLINKNILGDEYVTPGYFNPSYCFGGKLAFHFTNRISLNVEVLPGSIGQSYEVKKDSINFKKAINIKTLDFPVLLRFTSENQGYAELGVSLSTIKGATESYSKMTSPPPGGDVKANFKSSSTNLVIGIGNPIVKGETFTLNLGLRMNYALTDIASNKSYPFNDLLFTPANPESTTNPFTAMVMLEFHYYLGYFATSSCGKRKGFIFF